MSQDQIFVEGVKIDTIIGVLPHERTTRQPIELDLHLTLAQNNAARSDELMDTLDYAELTKSLTAYVESTSFQLIERLAQDIIDWLWRYQLITHVALELRKPQALQTAKTVGIRLARSR